MVALSLQVWWDFAMVKPDLQGNQGNIYGMNASSASLVKAFIELDPYKVGRLRLIPSTRPKQTWLWVALCQPLALSRCLR